MNENHFQISGQDAVHSENIGRQNGYKEAWTAYYGELPDALAVAAGERQDNVNVNYIGLAVDVKTTFLFGEPGEGREIVFTTDKDAPEQTPEEAYLAAVWAANRKLTTLHKLALNGQVCGDAYLLVKRMPNGMPKLVQLDPAIVTPVWAPDDIDQIVSWRLDYTAHDPLDGRLHDYQTLIEQNGNQWDITERRKAPKDTRYGEIISQSVWPFAWSPVHHCQNYVDPNVFWGRPDVTADAIQLNKSINFVLSNINRILGYHAHPTSWAKGVALDEIRTAPGGTIVLESPDATLGNLEMTSDLASSINFYNTLRQAFKQISGVPEVALGGIDDPTRVSSLALRVLYGPLLKQTGRKRITYGEMLAELNSHLLEMGGFASGVAVESVWPYVLPEDPYTEAQTMLIDQQLGASQSSTLKKRGYKPAQEALNRSQEQQNIGEALLRAMDGDNLG